MNGNAPAGKGHEGKFIMSHYFQMTHDPNGM